MQGTAISPECTGRHPVGRLPAIFHFAVQLLFAAFCGRLLLSTLVVQGQPGQHQFYVFWCVSGLFFITGVLLPRAGLITFLGGFPAICAVQEMRWIPLGNLASVSFSALFLGWLLRSLASRRAAGESDDRIGFGVNCLALALLLSSLVSLLHPSISNSVSVAFSIPSWPEKTEFNALTMGLNATAGCVLFGMMRGAFPRPVPGGLFLRIAGFQGLGLCLFALTDLGRNLLSERELGRNLVALPFGLIHNLGGPACLFAGFFLGLVAARMKTGRPVAWVALLSSGILVVVGVSVSKGSWLAVVLVMLAIVLWWRGWRTALLAVAALALMGFAARSLIRFEIQRQGSVAQHVEATLAADTWARNGPLSERLEIWKKAVAVTAAFPLGGVGLGSFSSIMEHFGSPAFSGSKIWSEYSNAERSLSVPDDQVTFNGFHCHNDLLELAAGAGLPTALLFMGIVAALIWLGLRQDAGEIASASAFALICFLIVAMIDSRLLSFPDNLLFWQFGAFISLASLGKEPVSSWPRWIPVLAPLAVVLGALAVFSTGTLPGNRTFGVWNWGLPSGDGGFLLAREAQFVIPPDETVKSLVFRQPDGCAHPQVSLRVLVDGHEVAAGMIGPTDQMSVELGPIRKPGHWTLVRTQVDQWSGRGALGSPVGVKPYAISIRKVRQ